MGRLIEVEWVDAVVDSSEVREHEVSDCPTVFTWGWELPARDGHVRVAGERLIQSSGDITYRGVTTIPGWVVAVREIKVVGSAVRKKPSG